MIKKMVILLIIFSFITGMAAADEFEFGISFTPQPGEDTGGRTEDEMEGIYGFHFAYNWWAVFYASLDSLVMPPGVIQDWTGHSRPGFLNLLGGGFRFHIGPVMLLTTVGINHIYVYKQDEDSLDFNSSLGANFRIGAGARFDWWGLGLTGTSIFPTFEEMIRVLKGLVADSTREISLGELRKSLIPSIYVTFCL